MAFDLTAGFDTLTLRKKTADQPYSTFTLYPTLPFELRLKILSHALPVHDNFRVTPQTLLADPSFGLYVYFTPCLPHLPTSSAPSFGNITPLAPANHFTTSRALSLLLVSHETRDFYLSSFSCSLPTPSKSCLIGDGRLRFHPEESIEITQFDAFIHDGIVAKAFQEGWRLQEFWKEVQVLVIPVACNRDDCVQILKGFTGVRVVRAKMWEAFVEDLDEHVQLQLFSSMRVRLDYIENKLKVWKEESVSDYVVPRFELTHFDGRRL